MKIIHEFKLFALKGSVIDLAVGIMIGAAFGKIVSSLVEDIITPAILTPVLKAARLSELSQLVIPGTAIKYGKFISEIISFMVIAFALFLIVRYINRQRAKEVREEVPPQLTLTEKLLTEIRDNSKK